MAEAREVFARDFAKTVTKLNEIDVNVWVMDQVPIHKYWVSNQLAKVLLYHGRPEEIGRPLAEHVKRDAFVRGVFERLESKRMHLLDPTPYFCGKTEFCRAVEDGRSLYMDYDHLNM